MSPAEVRRYVRFLAWSTVIVAAVIAAGFIPTRRLAGSEGIAGMWWGSAAGLLASIAGTLPLVFAPPGRRAQAALAATGVRFFAAGILGLAGVLAEVAPARPFLVWLGLSYAALLPFDAHFAATWGAEEVIEK